MKQTIKIDIARLDIAIMKHLLDNPQKKGDFLDSNPIISKSTYYLWKKNNMGHDNLVYSLVDYLGDDSWVIKGEDA